ncbi:hypothetical protein AMELA_G00165880 [Ameiurus melas]|uniref:Uncharacterized protein n=1 Tax=Ameiurus melas TaxID=219545 RepID=A0A7J6ABN8_AMEME|nr:hypothetical protein AMELA_G00165880 [Ameiurus melas]
MHLKIAICLPESSLIITGLIMAGIMPYPSNVGTVLGTLQNNIGIDYWLLSLESCDPQGKNTEKLRRVIRKDGLKEDPNAGKNAVLSYHEGIFWRCSYRTDREEPSILDFWISSQPTSGEDLHACPPFP